MRSLVAALAMIVALALAGPAPAGTDVSVKRDCSQSTATTTVQTAVAPPVAVYAPPTMTTLATPPTTVTVPGQTYTVTTAPQTVTVPGQTLAVQSSTLTVQGGPVVAASPPACTSTKVDVYRKSLLATFRANRESRPPRELKLLRRQGYSGIELEPEAAAAADDDPHDASACRGKRCTRKHRRLTVDEGELQLASQASPYGSLG